MTGSWRRTVARISAIAMLSDVVTTAGMTVLEPHTHSVRSLLSYEAAQLHRLGVDVDITPLFGIGA